MSILSPLLHAASFAFSEHFPESFFLHMIRGVSRGFQRFSSKSGASRFAFGEQGSVGGGCSRRRMMSRAMGARDKLSTNGIRLLVARIGLVEALRRLGVDSLAAIESDDGT